MDNTAREWSWPLTPSGLKVKNIWSHTSTLSQAFMAWRLLTKRKKFTFQIPNITVAEQKGSTVLLLLSRKQNATVGRNNTDTNQAWLRRRWLDVTSPWQSHYTPGTRTWGGSLTLWRRNYFFLILAHPVYKMWVIQEPNKLALWNKLHFEEKKTESKEHV